MSDQKLFFKDGKQHFFRPLSGKYREKLRACIQSLYLSLNGPEANCSYHLTRQDVLEIFNQALDAVPDLDDEGDSEDIAADKMASTVLYRLKADGWIDEYHDNVAMTTAFRFTPSGRLFAKSIIDDGRSKFRANHRNTRNARNSLNAYLEHGDPHDLAEAYSFAQEVFNDFNESIEEVELKQREYAEAVTERMVLEQATEEFFSYLDKRFVPDVSKMLGDDSIKRYESDINNAIDRVKSFSNERKAELERALRVEYPAYMEFAKGSILIWLLDQISRRIDNACNVKMPELRQALESFTRRSHTLIQQLARIHSGSHQDVGQICRRLKALDDDEQDQILAQCSDQQAMVKVGLVNPEEINAPKEREKREADTQIHTRVELSPRDRELAAIQRALETAFCIEDERVIQVILNQLGERKELRKRFLNIGDVDELLASMHFISLASNDHEMDIEFEIEEADGEVKTPYYSGTDYRVIIREKHQ